MLAISRDPAARVWMRIAGQGPIRFARPLGTDDLVIGNLDAKLVASLAAM
jgi:hypothetical protein